MRRNPDVEYFQEFFYPYSLIQRVNKLQRLVKTLSFPAEGVVSVNDISEHCNEEFGLDSLELNLSPTSLTWFLIPLRLSFPAFPGHP